MTARTSLRWLAWLGAALTLFDLLSDLPATVGDVRVFRVRMLLGVLVLAAAVYFAAVRLIVRYAWPLGTGPLAATALAAANPHYHWYFACLALPVVVAPSRALLWLATAPSCSASSGPRSSTSPPSCYCRWLISALACDQTPAWR